MHIDRLLSKKRILDLKSRDMAAALGELLSAALPEGTSTTQRRRLLDALVERSEQMQRRVGGWASMQSIRTPLVRKMTMAVGRFPAKSAADAAAEKPAAVPAALRRSATVIPAAPALVPAAQDASDAWAASVPAAENAADVPAAPAAPVPASANVPAPAAPAAGTAEDGELRAIFLILAPEGSRDFNLIIKELFTALEGEHREFAAGAMTFAAFREGIVRMINGTAETAKSSDTRWNRCLGSAAERLADETHCRIMMFFADTFSLPLELEDPKNPDCKVVIVTGRNDRKFVYKSGAVPDIIVVNSFHTAHRMSQMHAAMFVGLMRGVIQPADRICCVGGNDGTDKLDTIVIAEVAEEFPTMMTRRTSSLVPAGVNPAVVERAIGIATDLAVEGREGKPVGTIIVIGDYTKIKPFAEQLVMNPFRGYDADSRNLLNPFVEQTIKEWALIDGAFVVGGDGTVHSAGTRLTASVDARELSLPGLGTRHAAAAAISTVADCAAICVSSSGPVTLYRNGEAIVLLERSVSRMF